MSAMVCPLPIFPASLKMTPAPFGLPPPPTPTSALASTDFKYARPPMVATGSKGKTCSLRYSRRLGAHGVPYVGYGLLVAALLWFAQKYITLRVKAELYRNRSITDPLTGLYNRAGIAQISEGMFANMETKRGACLMLMDIDHFKPINDQRGHDTGDRILCEIATVAQRHLRANDHLGRWGGEEFVILCATKLPQDAYLLAEKYGKPLPTKIMSHKMARRYGSPSVSV